MLISNFLNNVADDSVELSKVYKVDVIQDDKDVDLSHIKDECMKKEVKCLVKEYKPKKEKDVNIR